MLQFKFQRQKWEVGFCAGSLLENTLGVNICRGVEEAGVGRSRWSQMQSQWRFLFVSKRALDPVQSYLHWCKGAQTSYLSHTPVFGCGCSVRVVWLWMREPFSAKGNDQELVLSCELSAINTISIWEDECFCPIGQFGACMAVSTTRGLVDSPVCWLKNGSF